MIQNKNITEDKVRKLRKCSMNYIIWGLGEKENTIRDFVINEIESRGNLLFIVDSDRNKIGKYKEYDVLYKNEWGGVVDALGIKKTEVCVVILSRKKFVINAIKSEKVLKDFSNVISVDELIPDILLKEATPKIRFLIIELSSICNLKCEYCNFHGKDGILRKKDGFLNYMTWDIVKEICRQLQKYEEIEHFLPWKDGESFMNPEWFEMTSYFLKELNCKNLRLYTNGVLLNEENIKKINKLDCKSKSLLVSLAGDTREECRRQRTLKDYNQVKNNILKAKELLDKDIQLSITVNRFVTEEEYLNSNGYWDDIYLTPPKFIEEDFGNIKSFTSGTLVFSETLQKTFENNMEIKITKNHKNNCFIPFDNLAIDSAGYLLKCPCSAVPDPEELRICNVFERDLLEEFLQGKTLTKIRSNLKTKLYDDICKNCSSCNGGFEFKVPVVKNTL